MRRLAALLLVLPVAACTAQPTATAPTPAPVTVTTTATATAPAPEPTTDDTPTPVLSTEQTFLKVVRDRYPITEGMPDATLVNLAESACGALDEGATGPEVIAQVVATDATAEHKRIIAYAIGAGVAAYCPVHKAKLRNP